MEADIYDKGRPCPGPGARSFNADQGSQFAGPCFTEGLLGDGLRNSMDGRGQWMGAVFIALLWRSLTSGWVGPNACEAGSQARAGIGA